MPMRSRSHPGQPISINTAEGYVPFGPAMAPAPDLSYLTTHAGRIKFVTDRHEALFTFRGVDVRKVLTDGFSHSFRG